MSGNSGAWGIVMWQESNDFPPHENGISIEGGAPIVPYLAGDLVGCLNAPPDGLGKPGLRTNDVTFAQRDGVSQFADYYDARFITLQVSVCNDGCPGCPTGREKVRRLLREWSRTCARAVLAIFTDCHDPDPSLTLADRATIGPYQVYGRPRIADVTWLRSNIGCAQVLLRFDAQDHHLRIFDPNEAVWDPQQCVELDVLTTRENLAEDPHLTDTSRWFDMAGSTGTVTTPGPGNNIGPHAEGFIRYDLDTPTTSSPMQVRISDDGVSGIPVTAGLDYTISAYWRANRDVTSEIQRLAAVWSDAGGTQISIDAGSDGNPGAPANAWWRSSETHTAPAGAEFLSARIVWSGDYLAGDVLDNADVLVEQGTETLRFFSGRFLGTWSGTADNSTSTARFSRINYIRDPRGTNQFRWEGIVTAPGSVTETEITGASDGPFVGLDDPGTTTYMRYEVTAGNAGGQLIAGASGGTNNEALPPGSIVCVSVWFRPSFDVPSGTVELILNTQNDGVQNPTITNAIPGGISANEWTRIATVFTTEQWATGWSRARVRISDHTAVVGQTFDIGYELVEYFDCEPEAEYFDGSYTNAYWDSTPNDSISASEEAIGSEIDNQGDLCVFPLIFLQGPMEGPITITITPDGFGQVATLVYSGDIPEFQTLAINTQFGTVQNGDPTLLTGDIGIGQIPPGGATVSVRASGPGNVGSASVCWENSVVSA